MTDNPVGSAHQGGDHGTQENPQEDTSSYSQTGNSPVDVDKNTPKDDVPEKKPSVESPDFAGSDPNGDVPKNTTKSPGRQKASTPGKSKPLQPRKSVVVRYGLMRQIGEFRHTQPKYLPRGAKVVVRTERGVELGEVIINVKNNNSQHDETPTGLCIDGDKLDQFIKNSGNNYPFHRNGRVLRIANQQDIIDYRHLSGSACEEAKYARDQIKQRKLPMKLVAVEHLLGGGRIVFHFTAESRVDFRELVHDLASQFCTRIEMRQVGARDEARLVADYERCGQRCCCQEFLKDLKPISMRMAKVQKATLDPSKISGRCSRLMCCLRYEDSSYEELRKKLPHRNTWVRTDEVTGKIIDTQIITQLVRLLLPDGTQTIVAAEDIIEHDVEPVSEQTANDNHKSSKKSPAESSLTSQNQMVGISTDDGSGKGAESGKKKPRKPRRRKKNDSDDKIADAPSTENQPHETREQVRARHIENAPKLPPLLDDAVTPISTSPQGELIDAKPDSIPLSELFGGGSRGESRVHRDKQIESQPISTPQDTLQNPREELHGENQSQQQDKNKEKKLPSDNSPKKKRQRRKRRRKK